MTGAERPHEPPLHGEVAHIVACLSPARLEAWLACGERIVAGMPFTQAERLMWAEIAAAETLA